MFFLPYLREKKMKPRLNKEISFYSSDARDSLSEYQLEKFNQLWIINQEDVTYYKQLVQEQKLPGKMQSWEDFHHLPIIDRSYVRDNVSDFSNSSRKSDLWTTTGGSTGTPLKYPSWKEE